MSTIKANVSSGRGWWTHRLSTRVESISSGTKSRPVIVIETENGEVAMTLRVHQAAELRRVLGERIHEITGQNG